MISHFPDITFIWKYEKPDDEFAKAAAKAHKNIYFSKWTPQGDLLGGNRYSSFTS